MASLTIQLLGDFQVLRDGKPVDLPASKKTRALLAYLIVTGRPQRRDRLCELFWELPDDPRGALRWSLSRLRQIVNADGVERLVADRERVSFDTSGIETDIGEVERYFDRDDISAASLVKGLAVLGEPYLGGVDLPEQPLFADWLSVERERILRYRAKQAARLIDHKDTTPDEALTYAREWLAARPYSRHAVDAVIKSHRRLGQDADAKRLVQQYKTYFDAAGIAWTPNADHAPKRAMIADAERSILSRQSIKFCRTTDNVNIAYASVGSGPPLVKAANWLTHLELDWNAPIWSPLFRELARTNRFIRYDERGNGLSDWDVPEISFETFVADLEAVVDEIGLDRFPLLGISQGAAVSIEFAVRHPERVSKLILFGGYPAGWRIGTDAATIAEREAVMTLTRTGWGQDNPAYRHIFSATFMPGASPEQLAWFDDFQRQTTSSDNAVRFLSAFGDIDVRRRLKDVAAPTLVLHSRGDRRIPWETGRDIATTIPEASLVTLESDNHLLLEGEPAAAQFVEAVRAFLSDD
ncbi:MAG: alpha/beta fold hydrolase [Pseudomonadota bacterium]